LDGPIPQVLKMIRWHRTTKPILHAVYAAKILLAVSTDVIVRHVQVATRSGWNWSKAFVRIASMT